MKQKGDFTEKGCLIALIGAAVAFIGNFLPFLTLLGESSAYISANGGKILLVLGLASIALLIVGALGDNVMLAKLSGRVTMGLGVWCIFAFLINTFGLSGLIPKGIGYWLILIGGIAAVIGGIMRGKAMKNL